MLQLRLGSVLLAILRLFLLAFVWITTFAVLVNLNLALVNRSLDASVFLAAILLMIPSALIVSSQISRLRIGLGEAISMKGSLSTRDLLTILNEEDLDDLRGEIREGLRSRIHRLSDAGPDSFEALLAEAGPKRKRGGQ